MSMINSASVSHLYDQIFDRLSVFQRSRVYFTAYRDKDIYGLRVGKPFVEGDSSFIVLRDNRGFLYLAKRRKDIDKPLSYFTQCELVIDLEVMEDNLPRVYQYLIRHSIACGGDRMRSAIALDFRSVAKAWLEQGGRKTLENSCDQAAIERSMEIVSDGESTINSSIIIGGGGPEDAASFVINITCHVAPRPK